MKLWLIKARPEGEINYGPWENPWDKYFGFVIRADSAEQARRIAADNSAKESRQVWLSPEFTFCDELTADGEPGIVLSDFNAG